MWASASSCCPRCDVFQWALTKTANREKGCFGLILFWVIFPSLWVFGATSRLRKGDLSAVLYSMIFQLQGTNEKVNGKSLKSYLWEESQRLFMIKAAIPISVFWHGSSWRCDGEKRQEDFELCVWFPLIRFLLPAMSFFQILDFSDFKPLLYQVWIVPRLWKAMKGSTIPLAIP